MKLENSLLFDHYPCDPGVGDGEQEEQTHDRTVAEVQELDAEGEGKEDASREDVDGPFETHATVKFSPCLYLRCFINKFSQTVAKSTYGGSPSS